MSYNPNLPADTTAPAEIRENFRALKEDKIVAANTANTSDKLSTARNINLTGDANGSALFDGSADVSITVDVTSADTAATCTGNAATATKLANARNISLTGDVTGSGSFDGSADLSIATTCVEAAKLTTARTISLTGDATGSAAFDGSADLSITVDVTSADTAKSVAWNNVTGKPSTFPPPVATASVLGGIKQGTGLSIAADGTASVVASTIIPSGTIVMWWGSVATIPSGWVLCSGQNGTPDLRDRFVVGAGNNYAAGATGGEATHTLTVAEMPSHNHVLYGYAGLADDAGGVPGDINVGTAAGVPYTYNAGGGGAHNNLPPYYALCFIMKQ